MATAPSLIIGDIRPIKTEETQLAMQNAQMTMGKLETGMIVKIIEMVRGTDKERGKRMCFNVNKGVITGIYPYFFNVKHPKYGYEESINIASLACREITIEIVGRADKEFSE